MANNLIPYKKISVDRKDRGESYTIKQRFSQAMQGERIEGVEVRLDSDENTVLYVSPEYMKNDRIEHVIDHTMKGLERDLRSKSVKIMVSGIQYGEYYKKLEESYKKSQEHLAELRQKIDDLSNKYAVTKTEKESLERQKNDLEARLEAAKQDFEEKISSSTSQLSYQKPKTVEELEAIMRENYQEHIIRQEQAIAYILYNTADVLNNIPSHPQQDKVEEARKTRQQKREYVQKHSLAAIEALPEDIQQQLSNRWKDADSILEEYENYLQTSQPKRVPIRLATTLENCILVFPWSLQPQHESPKEFSRRMQEHFKDKGEIKEERSLTTITLSSQTNKESLKHELAKILGEGYITITPYWIETDYFGGIPERKREEISLFEFIRQRSKEKGYEYAKNLAAAAGMSPTVISRISKAEKTGTKIKLEKSTIAKLATALGTTPEELMSYPM